MIRKYATIFCWKNVSSFFTAKATHIFSAKTIRILSIESAKTVKEMTLNELVKLKTLWTTGPWKVYQFLFQHPGFNAALYYNDIALLKLPETANTASRFIRKIPKLSTKSVDNAILGLQNYNCYFTGWGLDAGKGIICFMLLFEITHRIRAIFGSQ